MAYLTLKIKSMYKILLGCLPLLFACNAANNSPVNGKTDADTTVTTTQTKATTPDVQPKLPVVKWSGIKEMTDESFKKEVLASSTLTLVDFNATWCGPCKRLKPELEKLVKEYDGKINFASVDVDECTEAARYYNATSIPLLVFIKNAQQGSSVIGLQTYEQLKQMIDNELKKM